MDIVKPPKDIDGYQAVMEAGEKLIRLLQEVGSSRELSLAKTNAEQAVMWAAKHFYSK